MNAMLDSYDRRIIALKKQNRNKNVYNASYARHFTKPQGGTYRKRKTQKRKQRKTRKSRK